MIGENKWLPERDVNEVEPIRFKILVEILPEKALSDTIIAPDNLKKGDTTRKAIWANVVKVGNLVKGTYPGLRVLLDPSLDIMSAMRCFRCDDKHYMLCDVSDIIMVLENENEKEASVASQENSQACETSEETDVLID